VLLQLMTIFLLLQQLLMGISLLQQLLAIFLLLLLRMTVMIRDGRVCVWRNILL